MVNQTDLYRLREVITENLRVQRDGQPIDYVNVGTALQDSCSKQNHAIFARRGCGKTLLLHHSSRALIPGMNAVYLNCEDFKRHSFPNVLIEILASIFREMNRNLHGWFGRKRRSKEIIKQIIARLAKLQREADIQDEDVRRKSTSESGVAIDTSLGADIDKFHIKVGAKTDDKEKEEIERSFKIHREKLQELDHWLPELKENMRDFFRLSTGTNGIIIQVDDLYHLKRTDQAFVVDYIHRLCTRLWPFQAG